MNRRPKLLIIIGIPLFLGVVLLFILILYFFLLPKIKRIPTSYLPSPVPSPTGGVLAEATEGASPQPATDAASPDLANPQQQSAATQSQSQQAPSQVSDNQPQKKPTPGTYNPSFSVSVKNSSLGLSSEVVMRVENPAGSKQTVESIYSFPAGWKIKDASGIADGTKVADGTFVIDLPVLRNLPFTFEVFNKQADLQGKKTRYSVDFSPLPLSFSIFIEGDDTSGHLIKVARPPNVTVTPPTILTVRFLENLAFNNPDNAGNYDWSARFTSVDGETITKTSAVNVK